MNETEERFRSSNLHAIEMVPPPGIEPGRALGAHQHPKLARLPIYPGEGETEKTNAAEAMSNESSATSESLFN